MPRVSLAVGVAVALLAPSAAHADEPIQLGAFFGPRIFSQHSDLGFIDGAPAHPMLDDSVAFGLRIARQFELPWLYPEFELAGSSTQTSVTGGASAASVFWLDPRVQLRFELLPGRRAMPFIVVGAGTPIALSSARMTFNSGVIAEGYGGGGIRLDTNKGFAMRLDARLAVVTGENPPLVGWEGEISIGLELHVGEHRKQVVVPTTETGQPDRDGDGIPDATDKCPDRPEDFDGFEDADGCPDIDNDNDHVLDIADKCPMQPETYNGFEDEDGCPDTVPPDVEALKGTVEGLLYAEGETAVRDSAQPSLKKIVKVMTDHPTIKVVLIGHTDNQEAKAFAPPPEEGQPPADIDTLATELAHGRAEAVKQALRGARDHDGPDRRRRRRCRGAGRRQRDREGPAREPARPDQAVHRAAQYRTIHFLRPNRPRFSALTSSPRSVASSRSSSCCRAVSFFGISTFHWIT